jgi:hypothetical protein
VHKLYVAGQMCRPNMADQCHHKSLIKNTTKWFFFNLVEKEQQSIMIETKFFSHIDKSSLPNLKLDTNSLCKLTT